MSSVAGDNEAFTPSDQRFMARALQLAQQGLGLVEPNPMVGCVLTVGDEIIGEGYHAKYGGPHAERAALANAREKGNATRLAGCTAYVTLEPCCHHGKTPPCTDALLEAKIGRVVVAMLDPFPQVAGNGLRQLSQHGVQTHVGLAQATAAELNAPYLKRIRAGRPWVIAKWAMSLDGKLATHTGHSQWISCEESRQYVQELRGRVDAILVGSGTALADNPQLTARIDNPSRIARRIVADSTLRIPITSHLIQTARQIPTLLWAGPQADRELAQTLRALGCEVVMCEEQTPAERLDALLRYLVDEHQATQVMVEGGAMLLGSLLHLGQIDECDVFIAPKLLGGAGAPSPIAGLGFSHVDAGPTCRKVQFQQRGIDMHINCRIGFAHKGRDCSADVC